MWYKKKGDAVIRSLDVGTIKSIAVLDTCRPLVFSYTKGQAMLESEAGEDGSITEIQTAEVILYEHYRLGSADSFTLTILFL
jgi:hypothetical protein